MTYMVHSEVSREVAVGTGEDDERASMHSVAIIGHGTVAPRETVLSVSAVVCRFSDQTRSSMEGEFAP